jgi:PST family polysaccharide transporter
MTRLRQSVAWVLFERGLQMAIATVISAVLARTYGPQEFGLFQSYLSLASVWASVGLVCSAEVLMPRHASGEPRYASVFEYAFGLRATAALLAGAGYIFVVTRYFDAHVGLALPMLAIVLLNEPFAAFGSYFQTVGKQRLWSVARLSGLLVKFGLVVLACLAGLQLSAVSAAYAVEALVAAAVITVFFVRRSDRVPLRLHPDVLRELLIHGLSVGVGLCAMVWLQKLDRLVLTEAGDFTRLGYYAAGMQITENWFFCATLLAQAVAGRYVFSQPFALQQRRIGLMAAAFGATALSAWAVGSLLAPWVIGLIYGEHFLAAVPLLRWQLALAVLVWCDAAFSLALLADRRTGLFVGKWVGALGVAYLVSRVAPGLGGIPDPLAIPIAGYGFALCGSAAYYVLRARRGAPA